MELRRRAITVGITFFLALATGHLMQNADQISAFFGGQPMPGNRELTQVEPTVGVLAPVAAATVVGLSGAISTAPTVINDDLSKILPDLPEVEPVTLANETFLAKHIRFLGNGGVSPVPAPDMGHQVFGFH